MNKVDLITLASGCFGAVSAGYWMASARVNVAIGGYDMDAEVNAALKRAAALNGRGAACAAVSVLLSVLVTAAKYVPQLAFLNT